MTVIVTPTVYAPDAYTRYNWNPAHADFDLNFDQWHTATRMLWAYYANTAYQGAEWTRYRRDYRIYRFTRPIYNPTNRLVNFYAGVVYPGRLTPDPASLPEGTNVAIPIDTRLTPRALLDAFAQLWTWSNWQSKMRVMVRHCGITGSVLTEVIDDVPAQKVYFNVVPPGKVASVTLDQMGNVKAYALEYDVWDPDDKKMFAFRKEIDQRSIRYYRDGEPYTRRDIPAVAPNPYGFVPACWTKHQDIGHDFGVPAVYSSIPKIDELNSMASHVHDHIHKVIVAGKIVFGGQTLSWFDDADTPDQEKLNIVLAEAGGSVADLAGTLGINEAMQAVLQGLEDIEDDHPELNFWKELRSMREVSGVAASRLMGDAAVNLDEVQANHDMQQIKLHQMGVAIAGMRLADGSWTRPDRRHDVFRGYGLHSYADGDLDFTIQPRPILPRTAMEIIEEEAARVALDADRAASSDAASLEAQLRAAGPDTEDDDAA